jgi:hypothetical protein
VQRPAPACRSSRHVALHDGCRDAEARQEVGYDPSNGRAIVVRRTREANRPGPDAARHHIACMRRPNDQVWICVSAPYRTACFMVACRAARRKSRNGRTIEVLVLPCACFPGVIRRTANTARHRIWSTEPDVGVMSRRFRKRGGRERQHARVDVRHRPDPNRLGAEIRRTHCIEARAGQAGIAAACDPPGHPARETFIDRGRSPGSRINVSA